MKVDEKRLKGLIIDSGLVSKSDIDAAEATAKENKSTVEEVLLAEGRIGEDDLSRMRAYVLGIPFVDLKEEKVDFEVLSMIPEPIARSHNIVAFKKGEGELEVAMIDPQDLEAIEFIKKKVKLKILPRLTDSGSIKNVLLQYQRSLKAEFGDIIQTEAAAAAPTIEIKEGDIAEPESQEDLEKLAQDLPVVRIVDTLLDHAILQQASDIHIEPMEKQLMIRYRIDGILHDAMVLPKTASSGIVARIKVLSHLRLDEKRLPQDGRFKIETKGQRVSFRVSTLPTYYGEKTVMRLLPESSRGYTLESLGFSGENLERVHSGIRKSTGMLLVTGPTGSGKTTTLYTILDILNTPEVNISTIEDPIEYQVPRINQTQVKPDIDFTFASGLRSLLRQDPDVMMVGEIRDTETAKLAINAALTGHVVLSTLHTNSAAGAIPRLIDMGAEAFLLTSTLNAIVAQRLVRRLCKKGEQYTLTAQMLKELEDIADLDAVLKVMKEQKIVDKKATWEKVPFYKPKESKDCEDGYQGRVGIHEVLSLTPSIAQMVTSGASAEEIHLQAKKEGMLSMTEDGIIKAAQGLTSLEEIFRVANS